MVKEDKHGYDIALEIEECSGKAFKFNYGTLYPTLHKLEKEKLITGIWEDRDTKRKRKFYSITQKGKDKFEQQKEAWRDFINTIETILGGC